MPPTPRLQVNDTTGRRVVSIDKPVFRIGRRGQSDLRVVGGDVSREHAEIEQDGAGRCVLRDRGSRCGTFVNSEPVTERVLAHGDEIRLGRSGGAELIFLQDDASQHTSHGSNTSAIVDFRQISSLLDSLRALGPARVLDEVLALVMDSAIEVTGAERGFIMLADAAGELEFKIGRARGRVPLPGRTFETSQKIPRQVFATGQEQIVGDLMDGSLAAARFDTPAQIAVDPTGNILYVADRGNNRIRKIDIAGDSVTTLAGGSGACGDNPARSMQKITGRSCNAASWMMQS